MATVARLACRAQVGLSAPLVQVEVTLASGLPVFYIVGLPATVVKESRERVRAALLSCGFDYPAGRIIVNLAPAEIPKEGGRFELPMALGILVASGQLAPQPDAPPCELYGELSLDGEVKPVRGILLAAAHARGDGHELIVPSANLKEALIVASGHVRAATHLREVCEHWAGRAVLPPGEVSVPPLAPPRAAPDLTDVRGQLQAKRALLIAAAGFHSLLISLSSRPGAGRLRRPTPRHCREPDQWHSQRPRPAPIHICVSAPRSSPKATHCAGRRRWPRITPSATGLRSTQS